MLFQKLFTIPEGKSFWDVFYDEVKHFKEITKNLSSEEILTMIEEPIKDKPDNSSGNKENSELNKDERGKGSPNKLDSVIKSNDDSNDNVSK